MVSSEQENKHEEGGCVIKVTADTVSSAPSPHRRPVIGITITQLPDQGIQRISCHYLHSVIDAGGTPLLIPITEELDVVEDLLDMVDGILLTGGQDIVPASYGEAISSDPEVAATVETTPARDGVERLILDRVMHDDLPCAGVCRGMQMMNVYFGGTLYQDLAHEFKGVGPRKILHRQPLDRGGERVHDVDITEDSLLARSFGAGRVAVNSLHHQAVRELGHGLVASGVSEDGLVEGIEFPSARYLVGVQWHPEYFGRTGESMARYFENLVGAARRR